MEAAEGDVGERVEGHAPERGGRSLKSTIAPDNANHTSGFRWSRRLPVDQVGRRPPAEDVLVAQHLNGRPDDSDTALRSDW